MSADTIAIMKIASEQDVTHWWRNAQSLAVAAAWNELGLFEMLRGGARPIEELPANPRALAVTVPILMNVGLLVGDDRRVELSAACRRLLEQNALPVARSLDSLRDLSRMTAVIRDGGPVRDDAGKSKGTRGGTRPDDAAATERFLDMLYRQAEEAARNTFTWLSPHVAKGGSILDLGGGHGRYARAFADEGFAATIFDQPMVIDLARKRHGAKLGYIAGDFHAVETFGGPYDLVLLCNIVHGESAEQNASIIDRAAKSLKPGGLIAIRDLFLDEFRQDPSNAVFFGMTMLLYTEQGRSPTLRDARDWFAGAGLGEIVVTVFETHQIVMARKR